MPTQIWIIEGKQYPPEPIGLEYIHATPSRPFPIAYFCPFCGDIWARRLILEGNPEWVLFHKPCSKHPHSISRGVSGSIWIGFNTDSDRNLPLPVLRREALLHLNAYHKEPS